MILSGVGTIFISALSVFCYLAFVKHPFARKSRTGGRYRCREYSSQLAHRRGAGGRSLCLESFGHRSSVQPLRKRCLFWVSRLACTAIVVLLPIALSLPFSVCRDVTSFFQSSCCSRSGYPAVEFHVVFGPVSANHLANLWDRSCHFLDFKGSFFIFQFGSSLADTCASSGPPQCQTIWRQLSALGPLELLASLVISWQCGFLGTRVGEASPPGPSDILGAALSEANPYTNPGSRSTSTSPPSPLPRSSQLRHRFLHLLTLGPYLLPHLAIPFSRTLLNPLCQNAVLQPQAAGTAQSRLVLTIALSTAEGGPLSQP